MPRENTATDRRAVLKAIGASGLGITFGSTGTATAKGGSKYVGYTYDPVTREIFEPASAVINRTGEKLSGRFQLSNRERIINTPKQKVTVPLAEQGPAARFSPENAPNSTVYEHNSTEFEKTIPRTNATGREKTIPLKIETHDAQNLTGIFKYPGERRGLGYALEPVEKFATKAKARKSIEHSLELRQQFKYGERTEYHPSINTSEK